MLRIYSDKEVRCVRLIKFRLAPLGFLSVSYLTLVEEVRSYANLNSGLSID